MTGGQAWWQGEQEKDYEYFHQWQRGRLLVKSWSFHWWQWSKSRQSQDGSSKPRNEILWITDTIALVGLTLQWIAWKAINKNTNQCGECVFWCDGGAGHLIWLSIKSILLQGREALIQLRWIDRQGWFWSAVTWAFQKEVVESKVLKFLSPNQRKDWKCRIDQTTVINSEGLKLMTNYH